MTDDWIVFDGPRPDGEPHTVRLGLTGGPLKLRVKGIEVIVEQRHVVVGPEMHAEDVATPPSPRTTDKPPGWVTPRPERFGDWP